MVFIIMDNGEKVLLPSFDNLEKIGNKTKLKKRLEEIQAQGYNLEDLQDDPSDPMIISRIGRTYYLDRE